MTPKQKLLAYAQLLRLPNVFTAFADICMAGAATGAIWDYPVVFGHILLSSACLYMAGMVWNDVFDRAEDAKARPFRPIPSGRVRVGTASTLGVGLLVAGLGFALYAEKPVLYHGDAQVPIRFAGLLALAIFLYDGWLKRTPVGPVAMGSCRILNVLLGLSARPNYLVPDNHMDALHLAAVIGVYIVGVTWFARTEEAASNRRQLVAAAGVMAAALGLAVITPIHMPEGASPWYFPFLVVGFGFYVGMPVVAAIQRPEPKPVQVAVKRCILGLVVLDAVLATAFVGLPGLLILLLLPPALLLGKWVYST
jgi:4-hydroxybenzoate polyprenyltransferase